MPTPIYHDNPIRSGKEDQLNVGQFVARLTSPILDWPTNESLVVGLYAPWGTGKTSVLNLLYERLRTPIYRNRCEIIRFNPWLYSDADSLLRAFFAALFRVTKSTPLLTKPRKEKITAAFKGMSKLVAPLMSAHGHLPPEAVSLASPAAETVATSVELALLGSDASFDDQKQKAADVMEKLGKRGIPARLVVLIDDLDRAGGDEMLAMLKLVRLIADLPNVSFVFAMDYERVRDVLQQVGKQEYANAYLEKIIQIPIQLPPVSRSRIQELVWEGLNSIASAAHASLMQPGEPLFRWAPEDISDLILWRVRTLRDRARLLNQYQFLMLSGRDPLEVDRTDALFVSFLNAFFPELSERVRRNRAFFVGDQTTLGTFRRMSMKDDEQKAEKTESLRWILDPANTHEPQRGILDLELISSDDGAITVQQKSSRLKRIVLRMFPHAEDTREPTQDELKEWRRENRIAARESFDRYFTFSYDDDTITNGEVRRWIDVVVPKLDGITGTSERETWVQLAKELFIDISGFSEVKQAEFRGRLVDQLDAFSIPALGALGIVTAQALGQGLFSEDQAAQLVRNLLAAVQERGEGQGDDDETAEEPEVVSPAQAALNGAFAIVVQHIENPFDAAAVAADHVTLWMRKREKDAKIAWETKPVLETGLARVRSAVAAGQNVFHECAQPVYAVWRWRDLLRASTADYSEMKSYLRNLVKENDEVLPWILSLFAGWSNDQASLSEIGFDELRNAAEQIFGWSELLKEVESFGKREAKRDSEVQHEHLVKQFRRLYRRHQKTTGSATLKEAREA